VDVALEAELADIDVLQALFENELLSEVPAGLDGLPFLQDHLEPVFELEDLALQPGDGGLGAAAW